MEIVQSIIIGGVQGLSEFLPISSSGHLVIIPYLFNWRYGGLSFDVALHFGTAIALVAFFWQDWIRIISNAINSLYSLLNKKNKPNENHKSISGQYPPNLLWQIVLASIPVAIAALLFDQTIENTFHSDSFLGRLIIALNLAFFGLLLWLLDKYSKKKLNIEKISLKQSVLIGLAQALSLMPGVSRSGITITAGMASGLKRESAARFSFLLSTPAIVGAFLLSLKDIHQSDTGIAFWAGVVSSTIFSFLTIKFLLNYLKKGDYSLFVWYRLALAIIILIFIF